MINLEQIQNKINQIFGGENLSQSGNSSDRSNRIGKESAKNQFNLIADLLPYRSFDESRQIFINDNSVGFVLEAAPLIGASESVIDTLSGMFSDSLPEGCTIQFINFASPKIGFLFDQWQKPRDSKGGIYQKLAKKRIDYFKTANHQSIFSSSSYSLKHFRLIIAVSIALKNDINTDFVGNIAATLAGNKKDGQKDFIEILAKISSFKESFKTTLKTAGISSTEMPPKKLSSISIFVGYLYNIFCASSLTVFLYTLRYGCSKTLQI